MTDSFSANERARLPGALTLAACAAALAPLVAVLARAILRPWPEFLFHADLATIEIGLREVLALERAVGAYSRFGWAQPGPAGFLALAPAYLALGGKSSALVVGALALQLATLAGALAVAWRHLGRSATFALALAVLALQLGFGNNEIANPWPPFQAVGVVFFLLVVTAAAALRRTSSLLPALLAGSVAIQIHVGTTPVVAAILATGFLLRRFAPAGEAHDPRRARALALASAVVAGALWIPPLVEELGPHRIGAKHGNLSLILRTFRRGTRDGKSVGAEGGWRLLASRVDEGVDAGRALFFAEVPRPPLQPDPERAARRTRALLVALVAAAAFATWRRDRVAATMAVIALAGLAAGWLAAARIVGEPYPYLVTYLVAIVPFACAATVTPVARALAAMARARGGARVAALALGLLIVAVATRPAAALASRDGALLWLTGPPRLAAIDRAALTAVRSAAPGECVRVGAVGDAWVWATGVFLALEKNGVETVSDETLVTLLGARYLAPERDCLDLRLVDKSSFLAARTSGRVLASTGRIDLVRLDPP